MGCDIHGFTESKKNGKWSVVSSDPFYDHRNYGVFGFIANVRNYSDARSLQDCRGMPIDVSESGQEAYDYDPGHSLGWLSLKELLDFDYDTKFYDMRVMRDGNGAARALSFEEAEYLSYREFLGENFFKSLEDLKQYGAPEEVRVVFWFDN